MKELQILFVFVVFTISCGNLNQGEMLRQWETDKIGCDSLRLNIVNQDFRIFESIILGKSENYILIRLGEPNERFKENENEVLSYFIEPGIQCIDASSEDIDVLRLTLELQNGIVHNIDKILP